MSNQSPEARKLGRRPAQAGNRQGRDYVVPPLQPHAALPAPGTATSLATGAAGRTDVEDGHETAAGNGAPRDGERQHGIQHDAPGHKGGGHDEVPADLKKPGAFWVVLVVAAIVVLLGVLLAVGVIPRLSQKRDLAAGVREVEEPPVVNVQNPRRLRRHRPGPAGQRDRLAGHRDLRPHHRIRQNLEFQHRRQRQGRGRHGGDRRPRHRPAARAIQAQLAQNRAALIKAEADLAYNQLQLARFQDLRKINAVTQQQLDQQDDLTKMPNRLST